MAPSTNNEELKNSKMTLKRFWNKLVRPKDKMKRDKPEDEWTFDSIPDSDYFSKKQSAKETLEQPDQSRNMHNEDTTSKNDHSSSETEEEINKDKDFSEGLESEKMGKTRRSTGTKNKKSRVPPKQIVYNTTVNGGNMHIGSTNIQTYNIQQIYNPEISKEETKLKKNFNLTPEIQALLESNVKLDYAHITFLSKHFGNSWRKIGLILKLSNGLMDIIENRCERDTEKMSFEMLKSWMESKGDTATIGKLCKKLWDSKILNAKEAVKKLSQNISSFD